MTAGPGIDMQSDLNTSLPQTEFPPAADRVVRIQYTDDDTCDPAFDDSFSAWDLRTVSRRAWFQSREEGRTRQRLVVQLGLKKGELGVVSGSEFASEGFSQHSTTLRDHRSDLGRDMSLFAHAMPASATARSMSARSPCWGGGDQSLVEGTGTGCAQGVSNQLSKDRTGRGDTSPDAGAQHV